MRATDAARAALGAALLLKPRAPALAVGGLAVSGLAVGGPAVGGRAPGGTGTGATVVATRLLGGRWLLQGVLGGVVARRGPTARRRAAWADAAIETTHASSMLLLAAADRPRARLAGLSAAVALAFATADVVAAARLSRNGAPRPGAGGAGHTGADGARRSTFDTWAGSSSA